MRQSGRTTEQMREAPKDAMYVWGSGSPRRYATELARSIGRRDLRIVSPDWLIGDQWLGTVRAVVVDHAARLNGRQWAAIGYIRMRYCAHPESAPPSAHSHDGASD